MFSDHIAALDEMIKSAEEMGFDTRDHEALRKCLVVLSTLSEVPCGHGPGCDCHHDIVLAFSVAASAAGAISDTLHKRENIDANPDIGKTIAARANLLSAMRLRMIRDRIADQDPIRPTQKGANA